MVSNLLSPSQTVCIVRTGTFFPNSNTSRQTLQLYHQRRSTALGPRYWPRPSVSIIRIRFSDSRERDGDQEERGIHSMGLVQGDVQRKAKRGCTKAQYHKHQANQYHDESLLWGAGRRILIVNRVHCSIMCGTEGKTCCYGRQP